MSFITKRERVFNDYDLFDLPARNEGKLKAYSSCTDARAWSHFCSDKSEHLVEAIKRNNETVRPKYLPTNVIVDTLMVAKNAEIARLKRKIEEFEQMLTAYEQLELSCDQKCEIANAHAAIKAANKELYELCLDLDLSGYTEGIDSEGFETGKSRGDEELTCPIKLSKGVQEYPCTCEASTLAKDPRINELQETIITKDAKLNAMKNTIAVMENDVCEPYCLYAHIYTALEKIFGILSQNGKYKQYLKLLTAGKDIRCIDIKGKILFKLKVLEKFCCALIAPCTQDFLAYPNQNDDCACYRVDVRSRVEPSTTSYALTTSDSKLSSIDDKRAQLVADIIENEEMKEILSKENSLIIPEEDLKDLPVVDTYYSIDEENLKRLKSLQQSYDDLISCYETLKHEKNKLENRCHKYEEMEEELENLREQMREYNTLWNEKEHFRKRSADLDTLKEQYLVLTDETSNLETQLKAEGEINHIKGKAMDSLRSDNILLEQKLNDASIAFEKEKNGLMCQLKEADCRIMCQEQQIKSLLQQIDNLIDQDQGKAYIREPDDHELELLDEIQSSKEQVKNLRDALFCNEEEKQEFKKQYQNHLDLINELKLEIEDWKSMYEKTLQNNEALEKYNESLVEDTRHLTQDLDEKSNAVDNLISVIKNKSQEINNLMQDIEKERDQNKNLRKQLNELREKFDGSLASLENEKLRALESLQVARHESLELLDKVKDYDEVIHKKADVTKSLEQQLEDNKKLQDLLKATIEENKNLKQDLVNQQNNNSLLVKEIKELRDVNEYAAESINSLEEQKKQYETSLDFTKKESGDLKDKIKQYDNLTLELQNLQNAHELLIKDKTRLENELLEKSYELENALRSIQITKKESAEIIDRLQQSGGSKDSELSRISDALQKLSREKYSVQKELMEKKREMDNLLQMLHNLKQENEKLIQKCAQANSLEQELEGLKKDFAELATERNILEANKTKECEQLYKTLEKEMEENRKLLKHVQYLERKQAKTVKDIENLQGEKLMTESKLNVIKKESAELSDKIKQYESLETEYGKLKRAHDQMLLEKENLQTELHMQLADLRRMEQENSELQSHSQNLLSHSENLEDALIGARNELINKGSATSEPYKDIMSEIEVMRQEKVNNQRKIRDLRQQLDEAESVMIKLGDDVMARDATIATLQNNINQLEDEVLKLHTSLDKVINTGEEIRDFSLEKIDTLHNIEAHHSRATHNMKMELAKLQNENLKLSEELSITKLQSDEFSRNKLQLAAQVKHLQNEREIIVTDIKQLELDSVGDTALAPNHCDVKNILASLDRIRKAFAEKTNKSFSLEHTLSQVQTSSQLLASKADEARRIVEREKQKIISEKEDAIKDKQNMETKLFDLKEKLEQQISKDKVVIEDLEATIKNQKLINDRINKSTQDHISNLEDELRTLKDVYKNSVDKIILLEEKLQNMTEDKSNLLKTVEEIKANLEKKSKEVAELQNQLEDVKKKSEDKITVNYRNIEIQTDKELLTRETDMMLNTGTSAVDHNKEKDVDSTYDLEEINTLPLAKGHSHYEKKHTNPISLNEVQILSVAVEKPYEVLKRRYVDHKMKLLSTGKLEQHSITCFTDKDNEQRENNTTSSGTFKKSQASGRKYVNTKSKGDNVIDLYNRQSLDTDSSKYNEESDNITTSKVASPSQENSTGLVHEGFETDSVNKYNDSISPSLGKSTEKDLFIIYKDSENSYNDNKAQSKGTWPVKGRSEVIVEAVTVYSPKKGYSADITKLRSKIDKDPFKFQQNVENAEDDKILKLGLEKRNPKIRTESYSVITNADEEKKSLDSYNLTLYSSPKPFSDSDSKFTEDIDGKTVMMSLPTISDETDQYLDSYNYISDEGAIRSGTTKPKAYRIDSGTSKLKHSQNSTQQSTIVSALDNESHHSLSRVDADVLLLKAEQDRKGQKPDFGLEYIMDTVHGEVDPFADQYYASKDLRKTKSDDIFNFVKTKGKSDFSPSKLSDIKMSYTEYNTYSSNSKFSGRSPQKYFTDRSVMVKSDVNNEYENKINSLTKALENLERDYKKKIEAIKMQYDSNIKSMINEHNQGVKSIQSLHEETLHDIMQQHENEVENLRSMSIEAMKKADRLEKENRALKKLNRSGTSCLDEEPIKMPCPEGKMRRRIRGDTKMLTKTTVEAFNVKPKTRLSGPCTCSIDVNVSETIRNIFGQVDVDQRKMAEHTYLKYIANKILNGSADTPGKADGLQLLDAQELSFLHLKVCRTWKTKLTKEEALQKKIDSLETELINKQRNAQQHIAELDRKVAEERRRLQEVREAVCRRNPEDTTLAPPCNDLCLAAPPATITDAEIDTCECNTENINMAATSRRSAGDLAASAVSAHAAPHALRARRPRTEVNRATITRLDTEERRERRFYNDEPPTRLRRSHDRHPPRLAKK